MNKNRITQAAAFMGGALAFGLIGYFAGTCITSNIAPETTTVSTVWESEAPTLPVVAETTQGEHWESIGDFWVTAYCSCSKCCGKSDGITATGAKALEGRTIAVDPDVIPYGTKVKIDGEVYIAQDTMAESVKEMYRGRIVDIFIDSHSDALAFGLKSREVQILVE